jgi:hypothetical protein
MSRKQDIVAMSDLRTHGRFGNQLFQYAFLKIYANRYSLQAQTPPWIGQYLFGHKDPPISQSLQPLTRRHLPSIHTLLESKYPPVVNVDLSASIKNLAEFQPYQHLFRALFQPVPGIDNLAHPGVIELRRLGNTVVGVHIRRGDYVNHPNQRKYWPVPTSWYTDWLNTIWPTLDKPVLFVASDDLELVLPDFRKFQPVTSADVIGKFPTDPKYGDLDPSFYPDFYLLSKCDLLAISNSTFSYAASLLNTTCRCFMRPHEDKKLVPYDPWSSERKLNLL